MKTEVQLEELKNIKIEDYTYGLPEERIAKFPLEQREASQLLVYQEGRIDRKYFTDVGELLKPDRPLFLIIRKSFMPVFFQKADGSGY